MARKSNQVQRGGRWYFNKAYRKESPPVVGPAPLRVGLITDAFGQALRMRDQAEQRYQVSIDAAREKWATLDRGTWQRLMRSHRVPLFP